MDNFTPYQPQQIPPPLPRMAPMPPLAPVAPMPQPGFGAAGQRRETGGGSTGIMIAFTVVVLCVAAALIYAKARAIAGSDPIAGGADTRGNRRLAAELAQTSRSQIMLYKLQHGDRLPDFRRYPNWEQLTQMTDAAGRPSGGTRKSGSFIYGPYMQQKPVNPLNGLSTVCVVPDGRGPVTKLPAGQTAGFVMCTPSGKLFFTDASGTTVMADTAR